jgi:anti-sigma regulatory factor (Ser/Thr protein kinase)
VKVVRRFPHDTTAIPAARRYISELLADLDPDPAYDVELMVSELVTNSIRHTNSDCLLTVDIATDEIRVEVTDTGPGQPEVQSPPPTRPIGRGLHIVDGLSEDWGVRGNADQPGKTVWFTYRLSPSSPQLRPTC